MVVQSSSFRLGWLILSFLSLSTLSALSSPFTSQPFSPPSDDATVSRPCNFVAASTPNNLSHLWRALLVKLQAAHAVVSPLNNRLFYLLRGTLARACITLWTELVAVAVTLQIHTELQFRAFMLIQLTIAHCFPRHGCLPARSYRAFYTQKLFCRFLTANPTIVHIRIAVYILVGAISTFSFAICAYRLGIACVHTVPTVAIYLATRLYDFLENSFTTIWELLLCCSILAVLGTLACISYSVECVRSTVAPPFAFSSPTACCSSRST